MDDYICLYKLINKYKKELGRDKVFKRQMVSMTLTNFLQWYFKRKVYKK